MKKLLAILCFMVALPALTFAQVNAAGQMTASSTDCATINSCTTLNMNANNAGVGIQLAGTFSATVQFEGTTDGGNWTAIDCQPIAGGAAATSATATGLWQCSIAGLISVRTRVSAYTSGTVGAVLQSSLGFPGVSQISTIGTVAVQGVANGVGVAVTQGTAGTTAWPVTQTIGAAVTDYSGSGATVLTLSATSGTVITANTIFIQTLHCFNITGGAITVSRTDTAGTQFEVTFSIAANSNYYAESPNSFVKMVGLKMWASAINSINCVMVAKQ